MKSEGVSGETSFSDELWDADVAVTESLQSGPGIFGTDDKPRKTGSRSGYRTKARAELDRWLDL